MDTRGKDDIDAEVAGVLVVSPSDPLPIREKVVVREKETVHSKDCDHVHGKVVNVTGSTLLVNGKTFTILETTRITKEGKTLAVAAIKPGDVVCLDAGGKDETDAKVTTVVVLDPSETPVFPEGEIIREKEKVKETIRESK